MKLFIKYIFLLLFFILLGFLYMDFLEEDYFKIKNIEVKGDLVLLDGEVHDALITLKGKNIWNIDTKRIKAELEKDVRIKKIAVDRELPSKLKITIEEEKPFVKVKQGEKILVANEEGKVFSYAKELSFNDLVLLNTTNEEDMKEYLTIVKTIEDKEFLGFISEIYKVDKEIRIILNDGIYIKTDGTVDKKRYEIAKKLYKKLKNEGRKFTYIDIRFEDYIVK